MLGRLFAVVVISQASAVAFAQDACQVEAGRIASVEGQVQLQSNGQESWHQAKINESVCQGDTIRVGERSRAAIALANQAVMRLDQSTTMRLTNISGKPEKRSFIDLVKGSIESFIRHPHLLTVTTPYLNGSIEGTEFMVSAAEDHGSLLVLEGKVKVSNDKGSVSVTSGQMAEAKPGEAPVMHVVVRPEDAVQWTLYYPPILNSLAGNGDTTAAFAELDKVPQDQQDANYHIRKAALLLKVGQQSEASAELDAALKLDPNNGTAYALQAIIHVVHNERDKALAEAQKAVSLGDTVAARIALSYAQQAKLQLEAARQTMIIAVKQHPDDAEAWTRLAELQFSFGDRKAAISSAERAVALQPGLSRTQTVLGFVDLAQVSMDKAMAAFSKAIALDNADPLPRLGLGLAKIGAGDLQGGRGELDIAVGLDPNQAIIRSYLGKAYYEEKRDPLAEQQYGIAEKLDPNDPTPWFYDAITKQTTNQPVEALHSMNQAIDRNDNRAVYRSRLLLDSDQAARAASLARIYSDLGFQQLALVEGWKSVNTDPSNSSAHRFLADSYSALPNHEIARVSELMQSQLLQPLSLTPIQPQLSESDLYLSSSGGSGAVSSNEFNPLFYRSGNMLQVGGLIAGHDTKSAEAIVSGVSNNVSYSVGGYHFKTGGYRPNSDQRNDLANAFVQVEVSPDTSIQAEYRYKDSERGDVQLRFNPNDIQPGERIPELANLFRLGVRHNLSPSSTLLGSLVYVDGKYGVVQNPYPPLYVSYGLLSSFNTEPQKSLSGELQYLYRSPRFNLIAGLGHFDRNSSDSYTYNYVLDPGPPPVIYPDTGTSNTDIKHTNVYAYSNVHVMDNLTLTLGLSVDHTADIADSTQKTANDGNQYNPKFGLMWTPTKSTLVRLAAFRVMNRPVVSNQTLEPTQVAGFNQFYDDYNSTISRRYGVAVDQTFSPNLYGGLEASWRDLTVPIDPVTNTDWKEDLRRAYLFWTPKSWLGLKAEYQFEHLDHGFYSDGVANSDTHRLLLGAKAFLPSGWSVGLNPTYYHQKGVFDDFANLTQSPGKDSFWIVDATVSYRLPKRYGFVSVGVKNMFDQSFKYYDNNWKNATLQPGRILFTSLTLTLP
jgi:tetratricopeptide (TPR) repeat protein